MTGTDAVRRVKYDWLGYYWQEDLIKYSVVKCYVLLDSKTKDVISI